MEICCFSEFILIPHYTDFPGYVYFSPLTAPSTRSFLETKCQLRTKWRNVLFTYRQRAVGADGGGAHLGGAQGRAWQPGTRVDPAATMGHFPPNWAGM